MKWKSVAVRLLPLVAPVVDLGAPLGEHRGSGLSPAMTRDRTSRVRTCDGSLHGAVGLRSHVRSG